MGWGTQALENLNQGEKGKSNTLWGEKGKSGSTRGWYVQGGGEGRVWMYKRTRAPDIAGRLEDSECGILGFSGPVEKKGEKQPYDHSAFRPKENSPGGKGAVVGKKRETTQPRRSRSLGVASKKEGTDVLRIP